MSAELMALALAGLWQVVQYALMAIPANLELGVEKTLSPRDRSQIGKPLVEQMSPGTARLARALDNHFEALILFTLAVAVAVLSERTSGLTAFCAWAYLAARIAYVPAYYCGLVPWRSLIWSVGFLATIAIMLATLFFAPTPAPGAMP